MFCRHYRGEPERDCAAFTEIPDIVLEGRCDHSAHLPGDRGFRFVLRDELREDFAEVNLLRVALELAPFEPPQSSERQRRGVQDISADSDAASDLGTTARHRAGKTSR
jgi:hypothetical protein